MTETKQTLLRTLRNTTCLRLDKSYYDVLKFMRYSNINNTSSNDISEFFDQDDVIECFNIMDTVIKETKQLYISLIPLDRSDDEYVIEQGKRSRRMVPFKYKLITANCIDYNLRQCEDCDSYVHEDDATFIEGANLERFVCNDCLNAVCSLLPKAVNTPPTEASSPVKSKSSSKKAITFYLILLVFVSLLVYPCSIGIDLRTLLHSSLQNTSILQAYRLT